MGKDQLAAEYIKRAAEAEAMAASSTDKAVESQWREIAGAYRDLAKTRLDFFPSENPLALP